MHVSQEVTLHGRLDSHVRNSVVNETGIEM